MRDMASSFFTSKVEMYLKQKIKERDNEIDEIIEMQDKYAAMKKKNPIIFSLLQQKAIKEHSVYAYHYEASYIYLYTKKDLQVSYQHQRDAHKATVSNALTRENDAYKQMASSIEKIDFENNQKEQARQRVEQEKLQAVALQKEQVKPQVPASVNEDDGIELECNTCSELKKDAQRRCINNKCSAKYCNDCVGIYLNGKTTTCLYCFNDLNK